MAYNSDQLVLGTKTALAAYTALGDQYTFVKSTATATFSKQVASGGPVIGVLQDRPALGQPGLIAVAGVTKLRINSTAHAAIGVGAKVACSTASGAIISTAVGVFTAGRALESMTSNSPSGALLTVLLTFEGAGSSAGAGGA